jgi:hypothetical protein
MPDNWFYGHIVVRGVLLSEAPFAQDLQTRLLAQEEDCDREKAEQGKKPQLAANNPTAEIMGEHG